MALQTCGFLLIVFVLLAVGDASVAVSKPKPKPPSPFRPAPAPPCGMNDHCPADRWYCQECRRLVPQPSCLQNWCFKCSSYPTQTFACQQCITTQPDRGVQEWCLECIYQVNYASHQEQKTWACPVCASKAKTAAGMSDCIWCLKKAPAVNYWGCSQCMNNHATGSDNLNFCLACTGKAYDPNGCNTCAAQTNSDVRDKCQSCIVKKAAKIWGCGNCLSALPSNTSDTQKSHCLDCVSGGFDENACVTCAAIGNTAVRDGCHTCMTKPSPNIWGCGNCLTSLKGVSSDVLNQCLTCVGSGLDANGCTACSAKATSALRATCLACLAKPGVNVWECTK